MKIAITCVDGSVQIMTIINDADADECIGKWKSVHPGLYAGHRQIPAESIPSDREFRDAWSSFGIGINVDLTKAKNIHMSRLRLRRNAELVRLDDVQKPLMAAKMAGHGADWDAVEMQKQRLRDMPQTIAGSLNDVKTVDDLKVLRPI